MTQPSAGDIAQQPPSGLVELVDRFREHHDEYKSPLYKEAQLRREFLDPLFRILGWDVENTQGLSEAYKEVVHEDALRVGATTKAPDYSFRLGGSRQFFVEAKKPSVNLRQDITPAYQLRRYAWSAGLPVSVLTDFEEFAVYDCRFIPNELDGADKGRVLYLTHERYVEQWDQIEKLFSRDAVEAGTLRAFARGLPSQRGMATVDGFFLDTIEGWRTQLARAIVRSNDAISAVALNFAVQATIDRIVFLRICEDRGIEPQGQLRGLLDGSQTYDRLLAFLRRADDRYNSGLFHFRPEAGRSGVPDTVTPRLAIDDAVLKAMIRSLYYPESPYEFSVVPPEILGQVYEQFLGKVLVRDEHGAVAVEEKPEVRKAGGVYYTPKHVVDYIVRQAVGPLVENSTPARLADLRVVDPACGSGSFLIAVYQHLLDWYLDSYPEGRHHQTSQGRISGRGRRMETHPVSEEGDPPPTYLRGGH